MQQLSLGSASHSSFSLRAAWLVHVLTIALGVVLLVPGTVTMLSTRRDEGPWGRDGGERGATGRNVLVHPDGTEEALPAHFSRRLPAGSRLRVETPGGGGFGNAL